MMQFSNTTQIRSSSTLPQHGSLQPDLLSAVTSASIGGIWQPRSTALSLSLSFSVFLTRSLSVSHPMGSSLPTRHRCLQRRPFHAVKCSRRDLYTCSCVIKIQPYLKNLATRKHLAPIKCMKNIPSRTSPDLKCQHQQITAILQNNDKFVHLLKQT